MRRSPARDLLDEGSRCARAGDYRGAVRAWGTVFERRNATVEERHAARRCLELVAPRLDPAQQEHASRIMAVADESDLASIARHVREQHERVVALEARVEAIEARTAGDGRAPTASAGTEAEPSPDVSDDDLSDQLHTALDGLPSEADFAPVIAPPDGDAGGESPSGAAALGTTAQPGTTPRLGASRGPVSRPIDDKLFGSIDEVVAAVIRRPMNIAGVGGACALIAGYFVPWGATAVESLTPAAALIAPTTADASGALAAWHGLSRVLLAVPAAALLSIALEFARARRGRSARGVFWAPAFVATLGLGFALFTLTASPQGSLTEPRLLLSPGLIDAMLERARLGAVVIVAGVGACVAGALWPRR